MAVTEHVPASLEELADRYDQAWNDFDLEGILALQTPDSKFILRGGGGTRVWDGIDACRSCYDYLLRLGPDGVMTRMELFVGDGIYVANHNYKATWALPWEMGGKTYEPTGKPVEFEMVDIMYCEGSLVKVKDGWIDGCALYQQLEANAASEGPSA